MHGESWVLTCDIDKYCYKLRVGDKHYLSPNGLEMSGEEWVAFVFAVEELASAMFTNPAQAEEFFKLWFKKNP